MHDGCHYLNALGHHIYVETIKKNVYKIRLHLKKRKGALARAGNPPVTGYG
jgi:hypothetical protein